MCRNEKDGNQVVQSALIKHWKTTKKHILSTVSDTALLFPVFYSIHSVHVYIVITRKVFRIEFHYASSTLQAFVL